MVNPLRRLFSVPTRGRTWYQVILWWELRRFPYNFFLGASGLLSLYCFSLLVDGWFSFVSPPLIAGMTGAFLANFFYSFGWIVELLVRPIFGHRVRQFGEKAFKYGLVFSIFMAFVPTIMAFVAHVSGHRISSPYAKFTKVEPRTSDLIGRYLLVERSQAFWESTPSRHDIYATIELKDNDIFVFENIPFVTNSRNDLFWGDSGTVRLPNMWYEVSESELLGGEGSWKISRGSFANSDEYGIHLTFSAPLITYFDTTRILEFKSYTFNLQNEGPPYVLYYIMNDPDLLVGLEFVRETSDESRGAESTGDSSY